MATVSADGNTFNTNGDLPAVGSDAPGFTLVDAGMKDVSLSDFSGRKVILNVVVSLDTGICETSAKKFGEAVAGRDDVAVLVISADLPFAQQRVCAGAGIENVTTLSMMRDKHFAKDYGLLLTDGPLAGLVTRAVVVIDAEGKVAYTQLVPEIPTEPDYEAALAAL